MLSRFTNLYFPICSLTIMILLLFLFLTKKNAENKETGIYLKIIIVGFFEALLYCYICTIAHFIDVESNLTLYKVLNKLLYLIYIIWFSLLYNYEINISFTDNQRKIANKFMYVLYIIELVISILIIILPVEIYFDPGTGLSNSYGLSANVLFLGIALYIFSMTIVGIINLKTPNSKKYTPLFLLIILMIFTMLIRIVDPLFSIYSNVLSLTTLIMFFTIENPDLKIIEELTKAQKISENTNNEKTKFLYDITEDIDNKLNNVDKISKDVLSLNPSDEVKEYMYDLKKLVNSSRTKLKQTIDISQMDIKHLGLTNNKYNIRLLLDSVYSLVTQDINENIEFRLNISDELPNELYGDSIKLKQILISILNNSIKYTEKGFIELRVNSIIKNDICRLIMTIEDSGKGIDIYKQNEIMGSLEELNDKEIYSLDSNNINLKTIRKMISIIGGTLSIDNNKYNGTNVNITLDQKIFEENKTKEEKQIEKYSNIIKNQKKCAIVSLNKDDIKVIKNVYKKNNFKVDEFDGTKRLLDLLRNKENYDLIFIDEFMEKIDARSFISKTKLIDDFNSKIYVVSKNKDIKTREELLTSSFAGVVYSPIDKKELISKI